MGKNIASKNIKIKKIYTIFPRIIKLSLAIFSLMALFIGGLIYLQYRPHNLLMFSWLRHLNLEQFFPQHFLNNPNKIKDFCIFSLPNGLWLLSILILFGLIWNNSRKIFYLYSIIFLFVNLLFEILQFFLIISGTFDLADFITLIIAFFIGMLIYELIIRSLYEKKC